MGEDAAAPWAVRARGHCRSGRGPRGSPTRPAGRTRRPPARVHRGTHVLRGDSYDSDTQAVLPRMAFFPPSGAGGRGLGAFLGEDGGGELNGAGRVGVGVRDHIPSPRRCPRSGRMSAEGGRSLCFPRSLTSSEVRGFFFVCFVLLKLEEFWPTAYYFWEGSLCGALPTDRGCLKFEFPFTTTAAPVFKSSGRVGGKVGNLEELWMYFPFSKSHLFLFLNFLHRM